MNQNMAYSGNIQANPYNITPPSSPLIAQSPNMINSQFIPQQPIQLNSAQPLTMPNLELIQQVPFRFKLFPNITSRYLEGVNPKAESTIAPQTVPNISGFFTHKTNYGYVAAQPSNYVQQSLGFTNTPFSTSMYKFHNPNENNIIETHFDALQPNNVILHNTVHASPKGNSLVLSSIGGSATNSLLGTSVINSSNILSQTMPINLSNSSQIFNSQISQTSHVNRGGLSEKEYYEQTLGLHGRIISVGNPQVISSQIIPNDQVSPKLKASMVFNSQVKDSHGSKFTEEESAVMDEIKFDKYQSQNAPFLPSSSKDNNINKESKKIY